MPGASESNGLTLVSHHLCPYVQRAVIALTEKGVPFERVYIDLGDKPDWFKAISPLGKVPLLKVGEAVLFESAVILEYLEETQPRPLHPRDPLKRALHRAWIEYGSSILNDIWGLYSAADEASFMAKRQALREKLSGLEGRPHYGSWFDGATLSLVDVVFGPVFRYFDVFDKIADFGLLSSMPKLATWRAALADRHSIRNAVTPDYADRLWSFLLARKSHLSRLMPEARAMALA